MRPLILSVNVIDFRAVYTNSNDENVYIGENLLKIGENVYNGGTMQEQLRMCRPRFCFAKWLALGMMQPWRSNRPCARRMVALRAALQWRYPKYPVLLCWGQDRCISIHFLRPLMRIRYPRCFCTCVRNLLSGLSSVESFWEHDLGTLLRTPSTWLTLRPIYYYTLSKVLHTFPWGPGKIM